MKGFLLSTVALVAAVPFATVVRAQTADTAKSEVKTEEAVGIGEIVVTANKRSESVQKAPAAITALTGPLLEKMGIVSALDLRKVVSGAAFVHENNVVQGFIRGVGGNLDEPFVDPAIGININDINLPRAASGSSFFDLQRVEVLPGPQGTLYGGSATGGVVNLISTVPAHNYEGSASLEGGNYAALRLNLAQNIDVSDTLALRGAFQFARHDGYQSRGLYSLAKEFDGRISALWTPTEDFTASIFASAYIAHGKPDATVNAPLKDKNHPWRVPTVGQIFNNPVDASLSRFAFKVYVVGGRFNYDVGDIRLSYIPGLSVTRVSLNSYAADFPDSEVDNETRYSNEVRISNSESGRNSWQVGLYQAHTKVAYNFFFGSGVFPPPADIVIIVPRQINTDYAVYAQDVFKITPEIRLTAGGRYSYDSKKTRNSIGALGVPFSADHHWDHFDWKVGVDADLAKDVLGYATIQTGYLPGGYFPLPNTPTFNNNVEPERLQSYTVGIKSRLLDNRLTINDEAFYYIYKNYQIVAVNLSGGQVDLIGNAPRAVIYGNQFNLSYQLTGNDTFDIGFTALKAKFTNFVFGNKNLKDFDMANAPHWSGEVGYDHRFDLANGADVTFHAHSHLQTGYWGLFSHDPGTRQSKYTKTDVTLTYSAPGDRWTAGIWAKNIENTPVFGATGAGGQPGPASAFIEEPRTYGVKLSTRW
ncbi:TonB-dependent receptor [Sphingobium sp. SJ10-10]|uniref:TonB-dependent receptor n=1 Tax=Sphingobium sp. SJ10-10 TaxID=3114999 RepID=UPI002E17B263|nr:TonB-dependent receptor [Sphingobium sp. SJ10-10]